MKLIECFIVYNNNIPMLDEENAILVQYENEEREFVLEKSTLSYIGKVQYLNSKQIEYFPKYQYRGFDNPKRSIYRTNAKEGFLVKTRRK